MVMKEQIRDLLGRFLEKNKDYAVEVYMKNGIVDSHIARLFVTSNRKFKVEENQFVLSWQPGEIDSSEIAFPYNGILDCYVGDLGPDMRALSFQVDIIVVMKNGVKYQFQCVGMRG